jgi:cell division protein FtsW
MTTWLKENLKGDYQIWTIIAALSIISVIVVASASGRLVIQSNGAIFFHVVKHTAYMCFGLGAMWFFHRFDYHKIANYSNIGVFLSIALLLYAYKFEHGFNNANRWIHLGGMTFMPSDIAKLSLITNLASMLARRQHLEYTFKDVLPMAVKIIIVCGCIALTNVSTSVLLFATCFLLMFIGRVPVNFLAMTLAGIFMFGTILVMTGTGSRIETARNRIANYVNNIKGKKKKDADKDADYQIERSYFAIANGGIAGKGPGKSQQRYFLSESESDFIYAIIIEEWGMLGGLFVLILYLWLLYRGMKAVDSSGRAFGGLLSAGLTFSLVIQAMVHMGVATGLGPVTGQPLPLLSMGGSSLLFTGAMIGIIISVSKDKVKDAIL